MNEEKISRMDFTKIREDHSVGPDGWRDEKGNYLGLAPMKEFKSEKDYLKERSEYFDSKENPQPIRWEELKKHVYPKKRWTIKNLLPYQGLVILASPSGEKKSWFALEMLRCIIAEENFLGLDEFATEGGNVLYIDQEMPEEELHKRCVQIGLKESAHKSFFITTSNTNSLNLNDDKFAKWLIDFIRDNEIKAVFVDTLRAIAGGLKEDKAEDIRKFFDRFKPIKNMGVVMVFLDHCRKPGPREKKEPAKEQLFASQDKSASVELLIMIKSPEGPDDILVFIRKNRIAKELQPFRIVVNETMSDLGEVETRFSYGAYTEERVTKAEQASTVILKFLESGEKHIKEIRKTAHEMKIGSKNVNNALKELVAHGDIDYRNQRDGRVYFLKTKNDESNSIFD